MSPRSSAESAVAPTTASKADDSKSTGSQPPVQYAVDVEQASESDADQGLIPHATLSTTEVAGQIANVVTTAVDGAVSWVEQKVDKLNEEDEAGVGPYASPATCVPSDLDPLASGVMPAVEAEKLNESETADDGKDDEEKDSVGGNKRK